jgi:hypothetical protein
LFEFIVVILLAGIAWELFCIGSLLDELNDKIPSE